MTALTSSIALIGGWTLCTAAMRCWLGRVGYDPVYGPHPLKRTVQRYLQGPLTEKLLAGEVPDGSNIHIDEDDGELKIVVERRQKAICLSFDKPLADDKGGICLTRNLASLKLLHVLAKVSAA